MESKRPPPDQLSASQGSPLPPNLGIDNEIPTNTTTSNQDQGESYGTSSGVESSTTTASKHTMVSVSGSPRDIICGRGLHITNRHGNLNLHLIVDRYRQTYLRATRREKAAITRHIVQELKSSGSRFLKRFNEDSDDKWVEVDDKTAYKKVGHALRLRKSDHGQDFLKSLPEEPVMGGQQSVTLHGRSQRETRNPQGTTAMPTTPHNTMYHPSRLSSLQLPWPAVANQFQVVPTQAALGIQPQSIVPLSGGVSGQGNNTFVIDPLLFSQVFTSTLAMMTQMQHQQSSSSFQASSTDSRSSRRHSDGEEKRRGNR